MSFSPALGTCFCPPWNSLLIFQLILFQDKLTLLLFIKQKPTCILNNNLSLVSSMKSSRLLQHLISSFFFFTTVRICSTSIWVHELILCPQCFQFLRRNHLLCLSVSWGLVKLQWESWAVNPLNWAHSQIGYTVMGDIQPSIWGRFSRHGRVLLNKKCSTALHRRSLEYQCSQSFQKPSCQPPRLTDEELKVPRERVDTV